MAVLLALIELRDDETVESVWQALRARARSRACEEGAERRGPGWRAWAARSVPSEPAPLVDLRADGRMPAATLLFDRAIGDHDPADRSLGDWSPGRLLDDTASASILVSADGRRVELTRDVMGQRALVWARTAAGLVVASGEDILVAHPEVGRDLDLDWFAALIAGVAPLDDATAYRSIRILPTGAHASFDDGTLAITRQALTPDASARALRDAEVIERFGALVDQAVRRALRGVARPAISLSGGLDSALVAESVARQWAGRERPLAVSYGFDRWPDIDERALAKAVADRLGFEFQAVAADDLVPMRPGLDRPICPDSPYATPYREIKEATYRIAALAGCDAVLSGNFGDHLYAHPARWLADAVRHGRVDLVWSVSMAQGLRGIWHDPGFRICARPWRLRWRRPPAGLARLAPAWRERLTMAWRKHLAAQCAWPRPTQALLCLNAWAAYDAYGEDWYAARHRLAFRQPLRDPDLTRFMLSLPAFHSARGATTKWLARKFLQGRLPDAVVERPKGGDLTPFADAADRSERDHLRSRAGEVRPLLEPLLSDRGRREMDDGELIWLLASVAVWLDATAGGLGRSRADEAPHGRIGQAD
jgi:asparagine synthetase B (glutamine-hydrolysing)